MTYRYKFCCILSRPGAENYTDHLLLLLVLQRGGWFLDASWCLIPPEFLPVVRKMDCNAAVPCDILL